MLIPKETVILAVNRLLEGLHEGTLDPSEYILIGELLAWYETQKHNKEVPYKDIITYQTMWEMCYGDTEARGFSFRTFCNVLYLLEESGFSFETNRIYFPDLNYTPPEPD